MATIDNVIKNLKNLKTNYTKLNRDILDEIANYTREEIERNYQSSEFEESNDDRSITIDKTNNSRTIIVKGSQVLYTEFGTGTIGMSHPHPEKGEYNLNPYNSGKTIRRNPNENTRASANGIPVGGLYWTYTDKNGNKKYTDGIPAGMQVYRAVKNTKKKIKNISNRKVAELLSKL